MPRSAASHHALRTLTLAIAVIAIALVALVPVHCDFCDAQLPGLLTHASLAGTHHHAPDDGCNGVCSCCGFYWTGQPSSPAFALEPLAGLPSPAFLRPIETRLVPPSEPPRA